MLPGDRAAPIADASSRPAADQSVRGPFHISPDASGAGRCRADSGQGHAEPGGDPQDGCSPDRHRPDGQRDLVWKDRIDVPLLVRKLPLVQETNEFGSLIASGAHTDRMLRFLAAGGQTRDGEIDRWEEIDRAMSADD